jgi:hypothetical protein
MPISNFESLPPKEVAPDLMASRPFTRFLWNPVFRGCSYSPAPIRHVNQPLCPRGVCQYDSNTASTTTSCSMSQQVTFWLLPFH